MSKTKSIQFKRDFSPRKKGETAELETKLADYYLSIGVAELPCNDCKDKPCLKCNEEKTVNVPVNEPGDFDPIGESKEFKKSKKQK